MKEYIMNKLITLTLAIAVATLFTAPEAAHAQYAGYSNGYSNSSYPGTPYGNSSQNYSSGYRSAPYYDSYNYGGTSRPRSYTGQNYDGSRQSYSHNNHWHTEGGGNNYPRGYDYPAPYRSNNNNGWTAIYR